MSVRLSECDKCGDRVLRVGDRVLSFPPGDKRVDGRIVVATEVLADDANGGVRVESLSGPTLAQAYRQGVPLWRRHGIECAGFWRR